MIFKDRFRLNNLQRPVAIVLSILVLANALNFAIMEYGTDTQKRVSYSINKSGKQRMLSQKILAYSYIYITHENTRLQTKEKITQLLIDLEDSNNALINGSENISSALSLDESFQKIYYEDPININQKLKRYIYETYDLIKDDEKNLHINNTHLKNIRIQSTPLLHALNQAVTKYEEVAIKESDLRGNIRIINLTLTLIILFLLGKYVLFPLISRVKKREDELIEKEKFSNIVIESNRNAIIAINSKGKIIVFNQAAQKMFGYKKEEMLGTFNLHKIVPHNFREAHQKASTSYLQGNDSVGIINKKHKLPALRKNGEEFNIEINFGSEEYNGEKVVVANINDITEDIKNFEKISKLNKDLQRSLDSEKNFLASMSHEIRTPLNSVIGFLELLEEQELQGEANDWIKKANVSSNHLLALINDVLDVSKIQANQMELSDEKIDIQEILEDSLTIVSSKVKKNVVLEKDIENLQHYLRGDSARIKQILINILGNAAKFTEKGSIRLTLKGEKCGILYSLSISIEDTGKGIDKEKLEAIFSPFKQVSAKDDGTGLGLYISNSLITMMDGKISVISEVDKGTTFTIKLNLRIDSEKEQAQEKKQKNILNHDFSHIKVLMVDDVNMNLVLGKAVFKKNFNIVFDTAENGEEAVKAAKAKNYDIIFMDIQMPIMDGLEATKKIREFNQETPIIAMTANAYAEHKIKAYESGMNGYITKPVSKTRIEEELLKIQG